MKVKSMGKRYTRIWIDGYTAVIKDYQFKGRPPVGVRVSGTRLGEETNMFGEPCFFFDTAEAMSMSAGVAMAKDIIRQAQTGVGRSKE